MIFLRHGESESNGKKFFAGQKDVELSLKGQRQAELAADYITGKYKVDKIFSSDLTRAVKTAEPLSLKTGVQICKIAGLREIYAGNWQGKTFGELEKTYPETYGVWLSDIGRAKCDGGESVGELSDRIYKTVMKILKNAAGETVVISTHATPIRAFLCRAAGQDVSAMKNLPWVSNASVTVFTYNQGKFVEEEFGTDFYLNSLKTSFPSNV